MSIIQEIKQAINKAFILLVFVASIIVISLITPKEGKLGFEFQRGVPWKYDEPLIADFDFPIYKTEAELEADKDSILVDFKPYYYQDIQVTSTQIVLFERELSAKWEIWANENYSAKNVNPKILEQKKSEYFLFILNKVNHIFHQGIIDTLSLPTSNFEKLNSISIKQKDIFQEKLLTDVFTQKSAYNYITNEIAELAKTFKDSTENEQIKFYKTLDIYSIISDNLFYDKENTAKVKEELIESVSPTRGMVQKDELIVSQGQLIDLNTYRILLSYKKEYESKLGDSFRYNIVLLGYILLIFFSLMVIYLFLKNFRPEILQDAWKTTFILLMVILMVFIASIPVKYSEKIGISFYVVPFAILPITIRILYDSRLALFVHIITVLFIGRFAPNPFEHVFLNSISGIIAIFSLSNAYRRDRLVISALFVTITYSIVYLAIAITQEGNFSNIQWVNFGWFAINGVLILITYPLIFIFEKSFGFLSDTTLMELSDTNQPLLRKLAEEAPGTFQHSMQVANMAEEAIRLIGGNSMLVRTGALYHDIGKMENPLYFIENQGGGFNPHNNKDYLESAQIIINHVHAGIKIARKYNLPEQIIDFIRTHHGTTSVQYFYRSYVNDNPDKEVNIDDFTYPGPKPYSKETAVLMMADSTEAASRSLKEYTGETIDNLVDNIINYQLKEGQFQEADITFKDISKIQELFKKKLRNIYHARIAYPTLNKKK